MLTFAVICYISVNQFRERLKHCVERVIEQHQPLKVTRRNGEDFVVIGAEDWEREQETLYILQDSSLMQPQKDRVIYKFIQNEQIQ